jgi:tetratricopeptide (TPR) repeat protein
MIHSLIGRVTFLIILVVFVSPLIPGQSPNRAEQYYQDGIAKKAKGDLDGAIADYTKAIELNTRYAAAYVNRGVARKTKGDLDGAIADYDRAISLNPRLKEAYNNRGLARQLKGQLDDAIADFDKALELDPHYAGAHYNRASAARAKGDLKTAIAELTRAIESPDNDHLSETYNNRGTIRHDDGDTQGSLADFTKAIEIDPRNVFAYVNRGYALILLSKDDEAQRDFDQVLKLNPTLQPEVDAIIKKAKQERSAKKGVTSLRTQPNNSLDRQS